MISNFWTLLKLISDFFIYKGTRFALMEIKALFYYLLLNFNIEKIEKIQVPIKIVNSVDDWHNTEINLKLRLRA